MKRKEEEPKPATVPDSETFRDFNLHLMSELHRRRLPASLEKDYTSDPRILLEVVEFVSGHSYYKPLKLTPQQITQVHLYFRDESLEHIGKHSSYVTREDYKEPLEKILSILNGMKTKDPRRSQVKARL
jgi:hypothetical protein